MNPGEEGEGATPPEDAPRASGLDAARGRDRAEGGGSAEGGDSAERAGGDVPAGTARPGTDVQAYIGRQLRAVYDDVVKQPIPDRFLALMKQLEEGAREG